MAAKLDLVREVSFSSWRAQVRWSFLSFISRPVRRPKKSVRLGCCWEPSRRRSASAHFNSHLRCHESILHPRGRRARLAHTHGGRFVVRTERACSFVRPTVIKVNEELRVQESRRFTCDETASANVSALVYVSNVDQLNHHQRRRRHQQRRQSQRGKSAEHSSNET